MNATMQASASDTAPPDASDETGEPSGSTPPTSNTDPEPPAAFPHGAGRVDLRAGAGIAAAQAEWVTGQLQAALAHLGLSGEARVLIVGDEAMAAEHERSLGVAGTTDVITFDLAEGASVQTGVLDVDLMICLDEAVRQSARRGHDVARELLLYALHGVLHCVGYDDHDEAAFERMHAREDEVLRAIGVGAVYRGAGGPEGAR